VTDSERRFRGVARTHAGPELAEGELRYRTLVEQLPLVTYIDALDDRSSNIYTSPQLEPILGYSVEEWQADPDLFVRILHPEDRERVLAQIHETNATGERFESEYRLLARDGRCVWFRDESVTVRDQAGEPVYAQGYLLDITERKLAEDRARESEDRFRAMADHAPALIWTAEPSGAVTFFSSTWLEFTGRTLEEELGDGWVTGVHPDDVEHAVDGYLTAIRTQREYQVEYRLRRHDGVYRWILDRGGPHFAPDGAVVGYIGVGVDVTDQKEAQAALLRREAVLEAVAAISGALVVETSWENADVVGRLRAAVQTSRAYLVQDLPSAEAGVGVLLAESTDRNVGSMADQGLGQRFEYDDDGSTLVVPIQVGGEHWGHIGFQDCLEAREWTDAEVDGLRAAAGILGAAIHRQATARELRQTGDRLEALVSASPAGIVGLDAAGHVLTWNSGAERILGWSAEEAIGRFCPFIDERTRPEFDAYLARGLAGEVLAGVEVTRRRRDGVEVDLAVSSAPLPDADGEIVGIVAVLLDVTEEKRARDALAASEARFAAFMDTTPAVAFAKDAEGRYVYANARWLELFGQTPTELVGRTDAELFPELAERFRAHDAAALDANGSVSQIERVVIGGSERVLMTVKFPFRDGSGEQFVGGIALDVTKREQAEQELRETTRLLESIVESAPVAIVTSDREGIVTRWNPAAEAMFGWGRDDVLGRAPPHFVPGDADGVESRKRAQAGETVTDAEGRRLRRDGTTVWVRYAKAPLLGANGELAGTTAILTDVTERKAAEGALVETTHALEAIVDSSPVAIVTFDRDGRVTRWSQAAERTFGWSAAEVLGRFNPMLPDGEEERFRKMLSLALRGRSWRDVEVPRRRKDGSPIDVSVSSAPLRAATGEVIGMVAVLADVTERKRGERRLAAQHAVTRVLAESTTLDEAAPRILEEVCRALGWELGGLWTLDRELERLRLASSWHAGARRFDRFVEDSWTLELARGEGFPGLVWESGEARWFADVAGSSRSRPAAVAASGLHGALAVPIVSGGEVLGVLELFSTEVWEPDDDVVEMLVSVGSQIGQFLRRAQADRDVREREERFRTLVANLPGAIYRCDADADWTMSFLSDPIREITGYPASDFVANASRTFASVIHPDDRTRVAHVVGEAVRRKEPFELEYRIAHADGSIRWVAEKGQPIIGPGGAVLWLDGAIFDVTERKLSEEALARTNHLLDSIVENLPTPLFLKDADDLRFARVNRAAEELIGVPREGLLGKSDLDLFPREQAEFFVEKDRSVVDEQRLLDIPEEPLETRELGTRYLHTRKVPIVDESGQSRYLLGISLDITEQKLAAAQLERLLAQLEEQNERLRELDRMKDEFVALVSHELRTPLTSILGYLELVLEGEAGEVSDDQAHFLAIIERNAQRLLRLVGDLLFVAQIEAGKLAIEREPCDLAQLAADCIEAARPRASEKRIELAFAGDRRVELLGDRTRLAQLLDNLVSNAIKFTPDGGRVGVRLNLHGRRVEVGVSDTGIGIAPEELASLFQRFFRTSEATRHAIQGTGLGLTITKAIAEAHGGTIGVESTVGVGTTFVVDLPAEPALSSGREPVPIERSRE
jgi:PAS domain S-box-containing protein